MTKSYHLPRGAALLITLLLVAATLMAWGNAQAAKSHSGVFTYNPPANSVGNSPLNKPQPPSNQVSRASKPAASGIVYNIITSTATITPGITDIGSNCDDCVTVISTPFGLNFYGTAYDSVGVSSNGNLQFGGTNEALHDQSNSCLPTNGNYTDINNLLAVYWDDLSTGQNENDGVFTATLGTAPHRQFIIEWRTTYYAREGTSNEEVIFYEDSPTISVVYGANIDRGNQELAGIQEGEGTSGDSYTQYSCDHSNLTSGLRLDYVPYSAATTTPTPISSPTASPIVGCGGLSGWSYTQAITPSVQAPAVASDGTYVYSVGGYTNPNGVGNFFRFDPTTSTWITLTDAMDNLFSASAVYAPTNNKLYVFGGSDSSSSYVTSTLIYDIAANTWISGTALPDGRNSMVAGYYNGKIYLVGGQGLSGTEAQTWEYDIAANTWMTKTAAPSAMYGAAGGVINGHLYVVGGYDGSFYLNTNYDYDIATDTWTQRANLPSQLYYSGGAVLGGKLYIIGGGGLNDLAPGLSSGTSIQPMTTNETFVYDPATDSWADGPMLNQPRSYVGATSLGNALVAVGGYDYASQTSLNSVEIASLNACTPTPAVTATPTTCPIPFTDINGNVFATAIKYLYCRGIVNGIGPTTYGPAGTSTRAQFAKVVVLGFGIANYTPSGNPDFNDVPANYFAYAFIEAGFHAGILGGYDAATCNAIGVPYPCYGPNRPITRAQLTKLVVGAGGFAPFTPTSPTFTDVGTNNVFYISIETAHHYGIINGYPDNTFRPNNNIRRDEMAQIVYKGITAP